MGLRPAAAPRSIIAKAERSYVMVKPDGVQRGLVGQIITRFEQKGFQIKGLKMFQTPEELAKEHYKDLSEKPFYGKLVDYILSGPVVCIVRSLGLPLVGHLCSAASVHWFPWACRLSAFLGQSLYIIITRYQKTQPRTTRAKDRC